MDTRNPVEKAFITLLSIREGYQDDDHCRPVLGSGFVIQSQGVAWLITANHVIEMMREYLWSYPHASIRAHTTLGMVLREKVNPIPIDLLANERLFSPQRLIEACEDLNVESLAYVRNYIDFAAMRLSDYYLNQFLIEGLVPLHIEQPEIQGVCSNEELDLVEVPFRMFGVPGTTLTIDKQTDTISYKLVDGNLKWLRTQWPIQVLEPVWDKTEQINDLKGCSGGPVICKTSFGDHFFGVTIAQSRHAGNLRVFCLDSRAFASVLDDMSTSMMTGARGKAQH